MTLLSEAATALRNGQWEKYVELVGPLRQGDENRTWTYLAAEHPTTIDLFAVLAGLSNEQAQSACRWLLPAIGRLPAISFEEALALLDFGAALHPSCTYAIVQQLHVHVVANPSLGSELGERLRVDTSRGERALRIWAGAFAPVGQEAARYAVSLMTGCPSDIRLIVNLLDFLEVEATLVRAELAQVEKPLADLIFDKASELGDSAWSALSCICAISPTATDHVVSALDSGNAQAAIAVANFLGRLVAPTFGAPAEPLQGVVKRSLRIGLADEYARPQIDRAIVGLMDRDALRPHAMACLSELCTVDANVVEMFHEVFGDLAHHPEDFVRLLSEWLLRPDASLLAIQGLLSMCISQRAPVGLDEAVFVARGSDRWVKAARRLLGLTQHGPTLCQFVTALHGMDTLGDVRVELAGEMLAMSFSEYPAATEEFLKKNIIIRHIPALIQLHATSASSTQRRCVGVGS